VTDYLLFQAGKLFTMKSIILFSSIFYLLGLKIGHKIDLFKNEKQVEKITTVKDVAKPVTGTVHFSDEFNLKTDSLGNCEQPDMVNKTAIEKSHF
jgi:hypothetical protein